MSKGTTWLLDDVLLTGIYDICTFMSSTPAHYCRIIKSIDLVISQFKDASLQFAVSLKPTSRLFLHSSSQWSLHLRLYLHKSAVNASGTIHAHLCNHLSLFIIMTMVSYSQNQACDQPPPLVIFTGCCWQDTARLHCPSAALHITCFQAWVAQKSFVYLQERLAKCMDEFWTAFVLREHYLEFATLRYVLLEYWWVLSCVYCLTFSHHSVKSRIC